MNSHRFCRLTERRLAFISFSFPKPRQFILAKMNYLGIIAPVIFILGFVTILNGSGQTSIAALNRTVTALRSQVDLLTVLNVDLQSQINQLNTQLQASVAKEAADITALNGRVTATQVQIAQVGGQVVNNTAAIAALNGLIAVLAVNLDAVLGRVDKLESVNKIWKSNFQVVNSTFAELRKKFKIFVPVIRFPVFVAG